jgi:hypothetical protein
MIRELPTKTTPREEWSYITLVLRELLTMGIESFSTGLLKKLWKKGFKING